MIISDSSTLILLAKISLLSLFLAKNKVAIPRGVYEETVQRGLEKGEADAFIIQEQIESGRIEIQKTDQELNNKVRDLFGITKGENEVIALAMEKRPSLILTDDRKCIHVCDALDLPFSTCIDVVVTLYGKGRIDKNKAVDCLEKLKDIGWYSREIIEERRKAIGGE